MPPNRNRSSDSRINRSNPGPYDHFATEELEERAVESLLYFQNNTRSEEHTIRELQNHATLQQRMQQTTQNVIRKHYQTRPKNTSYAYEHKVKIWDDWCTKLGFRDGSTVYGTKLCMFLTEEVLTRRTKQGHHLKGSTVNNWAAAITDLWQQQQGEGTNNHPHPRDKSVKSLIKTVFGDAYESSRRTHEDRGVNHLLDGYLSESDVVSICENFIKDGTRNGEILFFISHNAHL
jgi:hypothetical protein